MDIGHASFGSLQGWGCIGQRRSTSFDLEEIRRAKVNVIFLRVSHQPLSIGLRNDTARATTMLRIHPSIYPRDVLPRDIGYFFSTDFRDDISGWREVLLGHSAIFAIIAILSQGIFAKCAI